MCDEQARALARLVQLEAASTALVNALDEHVRLLGAGEGRPR